MGGMTIMHLAAQRPEEFGSRVRGVVLVATSLGDLANLDLGLPWPLARVVQRYGSSLLRGMAAMERRVPPVGPVPAELWFAVRSLNYGPGVSARHVDEMIRVVRRTPLGVVSAFYAALLQHDGARGIPGLLKVPVAVLVGESDRLTPVSHANKIATHLPHAKLTVVPDAGHMVVQERPELVARAVRELAPEPAELDLIARSAP
jgi:pimeloyl-ACP methyl ester carboxylesterase